MYLDHHVLRRICNVLDMLGAGTLLMDKEGHVLYPQDDGRKLSIPEKVVANSTEPIVYGGVTLMGITDSALNDDSSHLYVCVPGDNSDVQKCVRLCCELIHVIITSGPDESDRNHAYRKLLRGECNVSETESLSIELALPLKKNRCVICVYIRGNITDNISDAIESCLSAKGDFWIDISQNMLAVVKEISDDCEFEELRNSADTILNALQCSGVNAVVGISDPKNTLDELSDALNEAREAINIGGVYCPEECILIYRRLMLERFLYNIPGPACNEYVRKVFNPTTARLFTDEILNTIEVFFKSNLNLSEAARMLGIHRNTLVYRLEKVEKLTGFDLRVFNDAVTFKMIMLLNKNATAIKPRI